MGVFFVGHWARAAQWREAAVASCRMPSIWFCASTLATNPPAFILNNLLFCCLSYGAMPGS